MEILLPRALVAIMLALLPELAIVIVAIRLVLAMIVTLKVVVVAVIVM